jgi:hypothetical protein
MDPDALSRAIYVAHARCHVPSRRLFLNGRSPTVERRESRIGPKKESRFFVSTDKKLIN